MLRFPGDEMFLNSYLSVSQCRNGFVITKWILTQFSTSSTLLTLVIDNNEYERTLMFQGEDSHDNSHRAGASMVDEDSALASNDDGYGEDSISGTSA